MTDAGSGKPGSRADRRAGRLSMNRASLWGLAAAFLVAIAPAFAQAPVPATPQFGAWGVDLAGRDTSVRPGDDFNRYANGRFLDALKIPPDRAGWGVGYALGELSENQVHAILGDLSKAAGDAPAGDEAKAAAFYAAFMDQGRVDALGARPLQPDLARIRAARDREALARLMGEAAIGYQGALFGLYIDVDPKAPDRYAVNVAQSGLGLPDRDYYLQPAFAEQKAKYRAYVARLLNMAGWPGPDAAARAVVDFETAVARDSWTRAEQRDPDKLYNPMTAAELKAYAPGFPWAGFLKAAELGTPRQLIVNQKSAFPKLAATYARTPVSTLRAWAAFHLVDNASPYLSEPFVQARFEFRSKTLSGVEAQRDRWKRAVAALDGSLGEAVGRAYVARHFPPDAKARIDALVGDLKTAFALRIDKLAWMSPATKAEAKVKLSKFVTKIGYPDRWRDYATLAVRADDLYGDVERAGAWEWRREVARLDKPVDRSEWLMTPQTVNAYYNPAMNEIVFPAGILQAPYFDPQADAAVNYGAIGAVIGHEITHGFDDEGRKTDGDGRLRNWWTEEDAKEFEAAARRLGAQYSSYEPMPGAKINGDLTMGENIADLGGLLVALDAYHLSLKGRPAPVIDGLTGDQRFFLAFAQSWRDKRRDEAVRQQLVSDPHAPEAFRVDGVVRNVDAWYAAFDVKPGDRLYLAPDQRARIW